MVQIPMTYAEYTITLLTVLSVLFYLGYRLHAFWTDRSYKRVWRQMEERLQGPHYEGVMDQFKNPPYILPPNNSWALGNMCFLAGYLLAQEKAKEENP